MQAPMFCGFARALLLAGLFGHQVVLADMPCGPISANPDPANIDELGRGYTEFIESFLNSVGLSPGTTVGIVRDGRPVYAMGFGVGNIEQCNPVGPKTGFYLLSTTKSFTGMLGALLQEDGVLGLDDPITKYFPEFALPPPLNAGQVNLRQLLTHGKPFSNGGENFLRSIYGEMGREEELRILSEFSVPKPPTFEYSNTGYYFAGLIYEEVTGKTWRELLRTRVLEPLKMTSTTPWIAEAEKGDFADRHSVSRDKGIYRVPNKSEAQMHPAGGLVSNIPDLSRWVMVNLSLGELDGEQVFPAAAIRQALSPLIQFEWTYYKFRRYAYGLGVHHSDYEGDWLIHHFGGAIHVSFMPDHNLGVIVLSNNVVAGAIATHRIAALTYDYLLGKEDFQDRVDRELHDAIESRKRVLDSWEKQKKEALSRKNPEDPVFTEAQLLGTYSSPRLLDFVIYQESDQLRLRYGAATAPLTRLDGNSFLTLFDDIDQGVPQVFDFRQQGSDWVLDWDGRVFLRQ